MVSVAEWVGMRRVKGSIWSMESDSGQYCRICFRRVDYSCHGMAPSLAVGWESFVVEWGL